ncbi:hypothetical protein [Alkaliphilus crotonatoxidans]
MNISAKFKSVLLILFIISVFVPSSYGDKSNINEPINNSQYANSESKLHKNDYHNIDNLNKELERIEFNYKNVKTQLKPYNESESSEELAATLEKHKTEAERVANLLNKN